MSAQAIALGLDTMLTRWAEGRRCALRVRAIRARQSTLEVCSDCDIAETYLGRFPEVVMDRPGLRETRRAM